MRFDDYLKKALERNPALKEALTAAEKRSAYLATHPDECPHEAIVAPVDMESNKELPGHCLDCGADNVMERTPAPPNTGEGK